MHISVHVFNFLIVAKPQSLKQKVMGQSWQATDIPLQASWTIEKANRGTSDQMAAGETIWVRLFKASLAKRAR